MMSNRGMHKAVVLAVYRAVEGPVYRAVVWAVHVALYMPEPNTLVAVDDPVRDEPPHPALNDFLAAVVGAL